MRNFDAWQMFDQGDAESFFREMFGEAKKDRSSAFRFTFDNTPGLRHRMYTHESPRQAWQRLRLMPHPDEIRYRRYTPAKPLSEVPMYLSYAEHLEVCEDCQEARPCVAAECILRDVTKPIICL